MIKLKRAYQGASKEDGLRILVERLWPRGVSKQKAAIDLWLRDIAPSTELRKWFGHDPARWQGFRKRYAAELKQKGDVLTLLKHRTEEATVTFVYAASDEERNSAVVLALQLHQEAFSIVDCTKCANCCRTLRPIFSDEGIERIADRLGMTRDEFLAAYLERDEEQDRYRTRTTPCPFLGEDSRCTIYDVRPEKCRGYPLRTGRTSPSAPSTTPTMQSPVLRCSTLSSR